ncbi:MAG: flavodoxin-dependent (E)-4-hydroxy-3-methylbut-2-enyl-diphosphate synthase [bacterium]|nr:flavodoxin-dependent (E)-4-hydroxy-3-methylbut-2-enyl-diphosphate synthase [bacterium]
MKVKIGCLELGSNKKVIVQSMTNTDTKNIEETVAQIHRLERVGCELVRVSVPDKESALALKKIKEQITIPLVADIHFEAKLALLAIENGADKIRINPGNIRRETLLEIINLAKKFNVAIRIGVNAGSLKSLEHQSIEKKAELMVAKALEYISDFEAQDFKNLVVSLKSSDIRTSILAYELFASKSEYPLHLGITEAGSKFTGAIKSSVGLGILLYKGIGNTIRVSLSSDPIFEVFAAYNILQGLGLRQKYPEIISCPTCARTTIDVINLVEKVENLVYSCDWSGTKKNNLKVAVMGCVVNGPGEAKEADFGICGAGNKVAFFEDGKIIDTFDSPEVEKMLFERLSKLKK